MRAPLTPIKAFIHDAEKLGQAGAANPEDDPRLPQWLAVAQAAERLAALEHDQRADYLRVLGGSILPRRSGRPTQIEGDGRMPNEPIGELAERLRLEAEDMERAGCFELALTTVSAVCHMLARGSLASRLLATAHLGRVNRQIGDLASAVDCYSTVTEAGDGAQDGPVAAHGFIGLGNVAYTRGNRPAQKTFFQRALDLAARGSPVELSAIQGLMVTAKQQGDLADALLYGWRAHDLAPPDSEVQLEVVGNLSEIAMESGFHAAAMSGYEFVLQRSTLIRNQIPSIIGGIRAAAKAGMRQRVDEIEKLGHEAVNRAASPFEVARFYFCAAESRCILGDRDLAAPLIRASLEIANNFGFHELRIRAESLLTTNTTPLVTAPVESLFDVHGNDPVVQDGINRLTALSVG